CSCLASVLFLSHSTRALRRRRSFPTRRSSDLIKGVLVVRQQGRHWPFARTVSWLAGMALLGWATFGGLGRYSGVVFSAHMAAVRSEEHTSELQSRFDLVCRLLLEKKNTVTTPA